MLHKRTLNSKGRVVKCSVAACGAGDQIILQGLIHLQMLSFCWGLFWFVHRYDNPLVQNWPHLSRTELIILNSILVERHTWVFHLFIDVWILYNRHPDSKHSLRYRQGCQHLLYSQISLLSGSESRSFMDICHDFCDCALGGFYGGIHPTEVRHSGKKKKIGIWVIHVFSETAKIFHSLSSCWTPPS